MQSNATTMKYFYDNAAGTPVDITADVQSINDIDLANVLERVDPYGALMSQFKPTGKGTFAPITIGFLFIINGTIEDLFAGRIPAPSDEATRTLTIEFGTDRQISVETHLSNYKGMPNKDNGLTRGQVVLQPTGEITETIPT